MGEKLEMIKNIDKQFHHSIIDFNNYLLDMTCIAKTSMRVVQMTIPLKINCERNLLRIMLLRSYISMLKLYIYFLLDYSQQLISNNFNFLKFVAISKHWPASNEQKNNYTKLFY